jgi:hypothetical protein
LVSIILFVLFDSNLHLETKRPENAALPHARAVCVLVAGLKVLSEKLRVICLNV